MPLKASGRATVGDPIGHDRAGAVAAHDVAVVGQSPVDRPDGVRVDAQGCSELADRGETLARLQPAGFDLVGELPVDLGRDRDVGITLDVETPLAAGGGWGVVHCTY